MNYTIRPFVQKDMDQIVEILKKIGWAPQYVEGQQKSIERLTSDEEGDVWVAVNEDLVIGFIQAQHHRWNRLSYIHGLVVSPDSHRQGIAGKLIIHVEQAAHKR